MRPIARLLVTTLVVAAGCGGSSGDAPGPDAAAPVDADACATPDAGVGTTCAVDEDCTCGDVCSGLRCVAPAACDDALLSWDGPVANTDGTCLTDLGGFKVRWGTTEGGPYEHEVDVGLDGCAAGEDLACGLDGAMSTVTQLKCSYRITGLDNGTAYIVVASYNTAGVESTPSGEGVKTVACP